MPLPPVVRPVLAALALATAAAAAAGCGEPVPAPEPVAEPGTFEDAPSPNAGAAAGGGQTSLQQSALLGTAPKATRTIAAMQFDIGMGPPNATTIQNLLMGTGMSLRRMYNEISYGIQDLTVDMQGPYTLTMPMCLPIECCGPKTTQPNGPQVMSLIAALPKTYNHYFWVYGMNSGNAEGCSTWGDEGRASMPAVYSSYAFHSIVGYSQELGHNFGMTHEPTITCPGNVTLLDDTTQCTHHEYGSTLSFMGGGAHHPSAYHKYQEGWIGGCNVVKLGSSATLTLVPQELPCNGVQLVQVPAPKTRMAPAANDRQGRAPMLSNYYLEMRAPYGFDSGLKPMVLISLGDALPTAQQNGSPYLYVLDLTPEANRADLTNAGLMTAGQSFQDPAGGLTFTLMAIDNRSATVNVTMTGGTGTTMCADSTPFTAPGPDATSCNALVGSDGGLPPPSTGSGGTAGGTDAGRDAGRDGGGTTSTGGAGTGGATGAGGAGTGAGGATPPTGAGGGQQTADAGHAPGETAVGGCACEVATDGPAGPVAFVVAAAMLAAARGRRRRTAH
jgi:MYXO-CTERM domain-containing protein